MVSHYILENWDDQMKKCFCIYHHIEWLNQTNDQWLITKNIYYPNQKRENFNLLSSWGSSANDSHSQTWSKNKSVMSQKMHTKCRRSCYYQITCYYKEYLFFIEQLFHLKKELDQYLVINSVPMFMKKIIHSLKRLSKRISKQILISEP